jgi:hypothetical protein
MKKAEIKNFVLKLVNALIPSFVFIFAYLVYGNRDKENYGTTIFQIDNELGLKSHFIGFPVYDFGINLGTELPLLSFWNITPIQMVSNVLGVVTTWFIVIVASITFLNLQITKLLKVVTTQVKYKTLISFILIFASPLLTDSFMANDWPAAWLAQVATLSIWVILYIEEHCSCL